MPLRWLYCLSRPQAEQLAVELGISTEGTFEELRERLANKWSSWEAVKAELDSMTVPAMEVDALGPGVQDHVVQSQVKLKAKVVADLVKGMPVLSATEPEAVLEFLIRAREIYNLKLVSDTEFLALVVTRSAGRVTQILSRHLSGGSTWEWASAEILTFFFPPRIREGFLSKYVLNRFQAEMEELSQFVGSVVAAAEVLGYQGPECELVHRLVQNMHPWVRSHLVFETKPNSIADLYALATRVAENRALDKQRAVNEGRASNMQLPRGRGERRPVSMAVEEDRRRTNPNVTCWGCSRKGHVRRNCRYARGGGVVSRQQENEGGVRQ